MMYKVLHVIICKGCGYHVPWSQQSRWHVGTNNMMKCNPKVMEKKCRLIGRRLKSRNSRVAFSEMLLFHVQGQSDRRRKDTKMITFKVCKNFQVPLSFFPE